MADNRFITMMVNWEEQRREIEIKVDDDIITIKNNIKNIFELEQINDLNDYQIQYYDRKWCKFCDLYPKTLYLFQRFLHTLLLPDAPIKTAKEWYLKIVFKNSATRNTTVRESIRDDTYSYQQDNDGEEMQHTGDVISARNNRTNDTRSFSPCAETVINNSELFHMISTAQICDEDEGESNRSDDNPQSNLKVHQLTITSDHPYGLGFNCDVGAEQRAQFEREMFRRNGSKTTNAGVLLRGSNDNKSHPIVHFRVPPCKLCSRWYLYVYVLTEADTNNIHYLHASKAIFNHDTKREERCGAIPNTELVNPFAVELSQDDLRSEAYELHVKVCNITNIATHKSERLRQLPGLNSTILPDDQSLLSTNSSDDLHFSNQKFHVGCCLVCNNTVFDQCISNLTIADKRKRNDSDRVESKVNKKNRT